MARGRGHKSYDSSRGASSRGEPTRGSSSRSRGSRARGGRGGGGGRGGYIGYNSSADTDFILQIYNNDDTGRYYSGPSTPQGRGRGRGRGFGSVYSPKGASGSPGKRRGQGRGRGGYDSRADPRGSNNSNVPLSISLRPLLRPVIFVPAQENKFLFQAEEELIQPIVEDAGVEEQSHVPTADRVARLFSGSFKPLEADESNDDNTEGLEEINFSDVGRFQQLMDSFASDASMDEFSRKTDSPFLEKDLQRRDYAHSVDMAELNGSNQSIEMKASVIIRDADADFAQVASTIQSIAIQDEPHASGTSMGQLQETAHQEIPTFFIDVDPSVYSPSPTPIPVTDRIDVPGLGTSSISDDEGDIVVYLAPHPRHGRSPAPTSTPGGGVSLEPPRINTTSILTGLPIGMAVPAVGPAPTVDSIKFSSLNSNSTGPSSDPSHREGDRINSSSAYVSPPVFTSLTHIPAKLKSRQRGQWAAKQRQRGGSFSSFASRGASVSEALLTNWRQLSQEQQPRLDQQSRNWNPYAKTNMHIANANSYPPNPYPAYANPYSPNTHTAGSNPYSNMYMYYPSSYPSSPYAASPNPYLNGNPYDNTNLYAANASPYVGANPYATGDSYTNWDRSAYWGFEQEDAAPLKVDTNGLLGVLASAQFRAQSRSGEEALGDEQMPEASEEAAEEQGVKEEAEKAQQAQEAKEASAFPTRLGAAEGMDVDPELDIDIETMKRFVEGMGPNGSRHVTVDDLEDERKMREEDEEAETDSSAEYSDSDDEDEQLAQKHIQMHKLQITEDVHSQVQVQAPEDIQDIQLPAPEDMRVQAQVSEHERSQAHEFQVSDSVQSQVQPQMQVHTSENQIQAQVSQIEQMEVQTHTSKVGQVQVHQEILQLQVQVREDELVPEDGQAQLQVSDNEQDQQEESEQEGDEVENVLDLAERILIAESETEVEIESQDGEDDDEDVEGEDGGEDSDDEDSDDQSPRTNFQARLERLRKRASTQIHSAKDKGKGKGQMNSYLDDSDLDDEDDWDRNRTWAEEDDDFIAHIQDILDENEDILVGRDRKAKKQVFQAVYNGDFEDVDMWKPARKAKDKSKHVPPELADLWKKDRAKKAIRKQERELARLAAAADPLTKKKGGKKGRKAMLAGAKLDPTIVVLPNRVIDMTTLLQQIRRFIADIGGPSTMSLPPANKQTRKDIHELAAAFNLKSLSKGKGEARYTTLTKSTMSGIRVNQKKVAKIVRRSGGLADDAEFVGGLDLWKKYAERSRVNKSTPKHSEGDEVGKAAPKINDTNIGFKMLASMGWTVGDSIGLSGGLQNPLTAVIKHTKLGLGAMK